MAIHDPGDDWLQQARIEVMPRRVALLYQRNFFHARPSLELFFTTDGVIHGCMHFKIHQGMNPILLGKPLHQIVLVLPDALNQIGCHAHVKRAPSMAGQNVDGGLHGVVF